jgi:hypothetical protein
MNYDFLECRALHPTKHLNEGDLEVPDDCPVIPVAETDVDEELLRSSGKKVYRFMASDVVSD